MPFTPSEGVPWWRVVLADGSLTNAKNMDNPGLPLVRALLLAEGVGFTNDGRIASLVRGNARSGQTQRSARPTDKPVAVCDSCFMALPATGTCDNC